MSNNLRDNSGQQLKLGFVEVVGDVKVYEYGVLVTSLDDEILTLSQHYRDRGDSENNFDELKNHWGWEHGRPLHPPDPLPALG